MSTEVPSPPSPRCDDWTFVERPVAENSDIRPRASSPSPEASVEGATEQELQEQHDGLKSPASERLADDLLREPFQARAPLQLQLAVRTPNASTDTNNHVEEPSTPTGASSGPYAASCGDLACHSLHEHLQHQAELVLAGMAAAAAAGAGGGGHSGSSGSSWGSERNRERLRAACRLSGEGALEGFQDPQVGARAPAVSEGDSDAHGAAICGGSAHGPHGPQGLAVGPGWGGLLSTAWSDLVRELEDVRALVATTAAALWERVQDGRMAVEEWAAAVREAAHQAAKTVGRSGCPLWALIGVSGVAAVALAALAAQLAINRRLASQLRQRDRDLARLVVKILNLQDALQSAARPILRHASLERYTTTTTLIGMV